MTACFYCMFCVFQRRCLAAVPFTTALRSIWWVFSNSSHLDAVRVVVQKQDSQTGHLLGLHHSLHVCQEVHVFGHISGQHLKRTTTTLGHNVPLCNRIPYVVLHAITAWCSFQQRSSPCRSPSCGGSLSASCWGFGRCHSFLLGAIWSPQQGGGSLAPKRRCTSEPTLNL